MGKRDPGIYLTGNGRHCEHYTALFMDRLLMTAELSYFPQYRFNVGNGYCHKGYPLNEGIIRHTDHQISIPLTYKKLPACRVILFIPHSLWQ